MLAVLSIVSFVLSVEISVAHHFYESGAIHFPLRNVQQSIHLDTFAQSQRNITVGKCEHVSDHNIVLNLPNLETMATPNPYPGFIVGPHVSCLNLASNGIYQIVPGSFDQMTSLSYLDLSRNRIQFCDFFNFGNQHPSLTTLIIEDNTPPMDNIDRSISKADCFPKLRYLYLRRNSIRELNFSLKRSFPALTHLFLSNNNVDTRNFIRDLPSTLTHLYLEHNLISSIDCKIMKDLQSLHLERNIIRSICYHTCRDASLRLEGVHKLTTLTVSENKITDIESCAFQDATGLTSLNLAKNDLEELRRETFEKLTLLKELNLDDNRLRSVPNLCNNNRLVSVSLRRNKLQTIKREHLKNMKDLKYLYLGDNNIQSIEAGSLEDLYSLVELDLSNNNLDFIPGDWMKWQWNLRTLDIRGNRFKCLEQMSLATAPFLDTIYMQNNPVSHITGSIVSKLASKVVIHLQNDCRDRVRARSECYSKCDDMESKILNDTYSRWINNL